MVDEYASEQAFADNVAIEMSRNNERYRFLRWGQQAFDRFRVVPPERGFATRLTSSTSVNPSGMKPVTAKSMRIRIPWSGQTPTPP